MNYRRKGIRKELLIRKILQHYFPDIETTRAVNRIADGKGIDFVNTGNFGIQVKSGEQPISVEPLLNKIQENFTHLIPVLIIVYNSSKRGRKTSDILVCMFSKDFPWSGKVVSTKNRPQLRRYIKEATDVIVWNNFVFTTLDNWIRLFLQ